VRRATKYHNNKRHPLHISCHFCTLSRIVSCQKSCILALVACLLPPAVVDCYICCYCSPCTSSRIVSCQEPCIFALVACLLPPAVIPCYVCCCCSPCENQARGHSGFGGHPGEDSEQSVPPFQFDCSLELILERILSNQSLRFSLITLWSMNQTCLHVAKIPIGVATNGCSEWGDAHPYVRSGLSFPDSYQFPTSVEPFTPVMRDTPSP